MPATRRFWLGLLALVFTSLNAFKPLHVDDAAYYYYAAQSARHPLDPYGFEVFWYGAPEPARNVLAPPVLPYWWALAIRLFGKNPYLWKLWLLPFSALFVFSLDALFRRYARGLEAPLVWTTVLSPTFLPSLNLMLDVPALALSLAAVVVFISAVERREWMRVVLAGLLCGLAMETKYTGFMAPAVILLFGALATLPSKGRRVADASHGATATMNRFDIRPILGAFVATGVAIFLFVGWESFMALRYGESHFLHELRNSDQTLVQKLAWWSVPLLALLGGVGPPVLLFGLAALGCRGRTVLAWATAVAAGYAAVAFVPFEIDLSRYIERFAVTDSLLICCSLEQLIFTLSGAAFVCTAVVTAWTLLRPRWRSLGHPGYWHRHRADWFIALWLALEVAGYFAMTPFGAVRRIMGIIVVSTLLVGRLGSRRGLARRPLVRGLALGGMALGLAYYVVDFHDASAWKKLARLSVELVRQRDPSARIWFVGHWGFQFYAEHAGMAAVVADSHAIRTALEPGDWLVIPDPRLEQQPLKIEAEDVVSVMELVAEDRIPFRTTRCYYGTATGVPLEHQAGPRAGVTIYRVQRRFLPSAE